MLSKILSGIFGSRNKRLIKGYSKQVQKINALEAEFEALSDEALKSKTQAFRERVKKGETLNGLLPEAFAAVREASKRTLKLRHFDVQLIGGMALHEGKIAEMGTGEGKTLVATLAVYLNTLDEKQVHVVTVNDYLARRDAQWMGPVYQALGLTVGFVIPRMKPEVKKEFYTADVIYATNNELGFDYLRNKMAHSLDECLQGPLKYAIVDEVDSILIDEARTPLIISGAAEDSSQLYIDMNRIVPKLNMQQEKNGPGDYYLDEKAKQVHLTEEGHQTVEALLIEEGLLKKDNSLYDSGNLILLHHLNVSLRANLLYKRDVDYLIADNKILIVDEHTGRTMPGRRWSEGLHQALEAKEGVPIQSENQTLASITFQNFFRLYDKLAGMTGTADTEAYEFQEIYGLEVVVIPTNKPCARKDTPDLIYLTQKEKFQAIVDEIKAMSKENRPVLVGTISIETSEFLSRCLKKEHIKHQVLNAKFHAQEAQIVAEAGRPNAVTIATNMAGRGTDIVLGGSLEAELATIEDKDPQMIQKITQQWQKRHDQVVQSGGLHILGTERHESRRIDNQLRGRAGRQGDPGSSKFFLSLEDNLMRIFASDKMANWMRKLGVQSGEAITHPWVSKAIENAQRKVEGHNFDIRKQLLDFDNVANDQRKVIYAQRDELLASENVADNIEGIRTSVVEELVSEYIPPESLEDQWDVEGLENQLHLEFGLSLPVKKWLDEDSHMHEGPLREKILEQFTHSYLEKIELIGEKPMRQFEKSVLLHSLDSHWKEHLAAMDYLRQSISLRGYAQKDPKQEYKREAFNLFTQMLDDVKRSVISLLSKVEIQSEQALEEMEATQKQTMPKAMNFVHPQMASALEEAEDQEQNKAISGDVTVMRASPKVGRNQECPCGSGKKFKNCHGRIE